MKGISLVRLSILGAVLLLALTVQPAFADAVDPTVFGDTALLAAQTVDASTLPETRLPDGLVETMPAVVPVPVSLMVGDAVAVAAAAAAQTVPARRPVAFEYSDAYNLRRKIHNYASWATLPLFGMEYLLGNKLWDDPVNSSVRDAHGAVATAIAGLFGVNTVTGVWNLWEGRKDPNGRKKRLWHSFLMLGADAGFLATGALAPSLVEGGGNRDAHRAVAISSVAVASTSYLIMLLTR
ncbi:MAG: hypothetical protein AB7I50_05790 [Vicinamibacterales bacterium]